MNFAVFRGPGPKAPEISASVVIALACLVLFAGMIAVPWPGDHGGASHRSVGTEPPASLARYPSPPSASLRASGDASGEVVAPSPDGARGNTAPATGSLSLSNLTASPSTGPAPLAVTFSVSVTVGPTVHFLNVTWSWGDGTAPQDVNKTVTPGATRPITSSHTYSTAGTYQMNVTGFDQTPEINVSANITVVVQPGPTINVSATATPANVTIGRPVVLLGSASGGTAPYTYKWKELPTGCTQSPTVLGEANCVAKATGSNVAVLEAFDARGYEGAVTVSFWVNAKMSITGSEVSSWYRCVNGVGLFEANFTGNVTGGGTAPFSYTWNPKDGSANITGQNISHNYTVSGVFDVVLNVTDASGSTTNRSVPISTSFASCAGLGTTAAPVPTALIAALVGVSILVVILIVLLGRTRPPGPRGPVQPADLPSEEPTPVPPEEVAPAAGAPPPASPEGEGPSPSD